MRRFLARIRNAFAQIPLLGWLLGALAAVIVEQFAGYPLAEYLGMSEMPALFGLENLAQPALLPGAILYALLIYILPFGIVSWLSSWPANWLAKQLSSLPPRVSLP